jgi:hypothetical protein
LARRAAYDEAAFLGPLKKARQAIDSAFLEARSVDDVRRAEARLDELQRFLDAVKQIDGPSELLKPVTDGGPPSGDLYELQVGAWRAYYLINPTTKSYYAAAVFHPSMPLNRRLSELQWPEN